MRSVIPIFFKIWHEKSDNNIKKEKEVDEVIECFPDHYLLFYKAEPERKGNSDINLIGKLTFFKA